MSPWNLDVCIDSLSIPFVETLIRRDKEEIKIFQVPIMSHALEYHYYYLIIADNWSSHSSTNK